MKNRTVSILGICAALLLLSGPVAAEKDGHHSKGHSEWTPLSSHGDGHHKKQCDSQKKQCDNKKQCDKKKHDNHASKGKYGKKSGILKHRAELELTDAQVKQVKTLLNETKKATIMLKAEVEVTEIDLKTLKHTYPIDMEASAAAIKMIATKNADISIAWLQFRVDSKAVLTAEQQTKLKEIYRNKHSRKGHHH